MTLVEACVTTVSEAVAAAEAGAQRLELCSNLEVGGLTPPISLLEDVRAHVDVPVYVMIRPRPGSYVMTGEELSTMRETIPRHRAAGADGFVFGVLAADRVVDREALAALVRVAQPSPVTFHRAFDDVREQLAAVDELIAAGVARVLTGGGPGSAWEGRTQLAELVRRAGDRMVIMAGGRVRGNHVVSLVREAGLMEVHARASAIGAVVSALAQGSGPDSAAVPG